MTLRHQVSLTDLPLGLLLKIYIEKVGTHEDQRPDLQLNLLQHATGDILQNLEQQRSLGQRNTTGQKRNIVIGLQAIVVKILLVVLMTVKQVMILIPLMIPPERDDTGTLPQMNRLKKGIKENITEGEKEALCLPK